ncbi:glycosyltransferase family 4 protein [Methylobacterium fujisawaense]
MRLAFVTYEFWPSTPGGAGVLVHHAVRQALEEGHEVHIIIDTDDATMNRLIGDVSDLRGSTDLYCHHVPSIYPSGSLSSESFSSEIFFRSYRFATAVRLLHNLHQFDYLEFFDYNGPAYHTLIQRTQDPDCFPKKIAVRAHNTIEIISERTGFGVHARSFFNFIAERQACYLADAIVAPTSRFFYEEYQQRYNINSRRMIEGFPYCHPLLHESVEVHKKETDLVVFYGRLSTLKGLDTFLKAAELILRSSDRAIEFLIIGPQEHVIGNIQDQLARLIGIFGDKIKAIGEVNRNDLPKIIAGAACAVFANRSESFCYAAHELFMLGIPLIVNDIPGFRGSFPREGSVAFFDGSAQDLTKKISEILDDCNLDETLRLRIGDDLTRYAGTSYNEIVTNVQNFTPKFSDDLLHLNIILISDTPVIRRIWDEIDLPPNVNFDIAVFSPAVRSARNIKLFSRELALEPVSTISSVFTILSSDDIIITRDIKSLNLEHIVALLRARAERFVVFDEALYHSAPGPGDASAPDLEQYLCLPIDQHRWFALRHSGMETLFDLEQLFAETTFPAPLTAAHKAIYNLPVVTLPGRPITPFASAVRRQANDQQRGPMAQLIKHWSSYSAQHKDSIVIVNHLGHPMSECWAVGITSDEGRLSYRDAPVFPSGAFDVFDDVDLAGVRSRAVHLKSGALAFHRVKNKTVRLFMHPYSGEVIIFFNGRFEWANLKSDVATVIDLEVSSAKPDLELEVTINVVWPATTVRNASYSSTLTRMTSSIARQFPNIEQITLDFADQEARNDPSLPMGQLLTLSSQSRSQELDCLFSALRHNGFRLIRCALPPHGLSTIPDILNMFARVSERDPGASLILAIDELNFLAMDAIEFRDLRTVVELLRKEARFPIQIESGGRRIANYLQQHGIAGRIDEVAWPIFQMRDRSVESSTPVIGVFASESVVRTCAHMLAAIALSKFSGQIELWNGQATDLDLEILFPFANLIARRGEPSDDELAAYAAILQVFPDSHSAMLLRRSAKVGTPFVTGPSSETLLAVPQLRELAVCTMWEDSTDLAEHLEAILDVERFADTFNSALAVITQSGTRSAR